jgi:hypothetical protein
MIDAFANLLRTLHELNIVVFPYFLGITGIVVAFVMRKAVFVDRYGLQIIAIVVLVPAILVSWERKWLSSDAGALILSGIAVYVFGSGRRGGPSDRN